VDVAKGKGWGEVSVEEILEVPVLNRDFVGKKGFWFCAGGRNPFGLAAEPCHFELGIKDVRKEWR